MLRAANRNVKAQYCWGREKNNIAAARKHGKKALLLIENHDMTSAEFPLMDRGLPKVMALGAEQLIYYCIL
jgi:hypothetical protein